MIELVLWHLSQLSFAAHTPGLIVLADDLLVLAASHLSMTELLKSTILMMYKDLQKAAYLAICLQPSAKTSCF